MDNLETIDLSIGQILSLSTGVLMCVSSEYHRGINHLMGDMNTGMIGTLISFAKEDIEMQYPWLKDVDSAGITPDNYMDIVNRLSAIHGDTFPVTRITEERMLEIKDVLREKTMYIED